VSLSSFGTPREATLIGWLVVRTTGLRVVSLIIMAVFYPMRREARRFSWSSDTPKHHAEGLRGARGSPARRFSSRSRFPDEITYDPVPDESPIEHELVREATLLDLEIVDTNVEPTVGNENWHVRVRIQADGDLIETCGFGLIFTLGMLSFHDARPRGVSDKWFVSCIVSDVSQPCSDERRERIIDEEPQEAGSSGNCRSRTASAA